MTPALELLREAFDMLEEDFEEERFFVDRPAHATGRRRPGIARAGATRAEADSIRTALEFYDARRLLSMDYKQAGVDIDAGNEVVRRIRSLARGTFTPGVLSEIGSFGGLFQLGAGRRRRIPVLVASADGVGTKLRVAFMTGVHTTIGVDLVNHCVNDILVQGAQPLFFLDYLATGRLDPDVAVQIVEGLAAACRENGCALLGGETAEMPGFYADGEYDVAGFIVGVVARDALIDGKTHRARRRADRPAVVRAAHQRLLAGAADCVRHRRAARRTASRAGARRDDRRGAARAAPVVSAGRSGRCWASGLIKGMAHITGGGITDNLPRMLPRGHARRRSIARAWEVPALFQWLQRTGSVPDADMLRTFNMGIGLIIACAQRRRGAVCDAARGGRRAQAPCASARSRARRRGRRSV